MLLLYVNVKDAPQGSIIFNKIFIPFLVEYDLDIKCNYRDTIPCRSINLRSVVIFFHDNIVYKDNTNMAPPLKPPNLPMTLTFVPFTVYLEN